LYGDDDESDDDANRGRVEPQAKKTSKDDEMKAGGQTARVLGAFGRRGKFDDGDDTHPPFHSVKEGGLSQKQTVASNETRQPTNRDLVTPRAIANNKNQEQQIQAAPCPSDNQPALFARTTNKPSEKRGHETSSVSTKATTAKAIDQKGKSIDTEQMDKPASKNSSPPKTLERTSGETYTRKNETLPRASPSSRFDWVDLISDLSKEDTALSKARTRNVSRLREANESDGHELSKYLPTDIREIFPFGLEGPEDNWTPSPEWTQRVALVGRTPCPIPASPLFSFSTEEESVRHNTEFLEIRGWDLASALHEHKGTTVDHGSEFRPVDQLLSIVGGHPNFTFLKGIFEDGFHYHLTHKLSEAERTEEYDAQYDRGNHQSAILDIEQVVKLLGTDVRQGFALPINADEVHKLLGVHLQPGGIVSQHSINSDGSRKLKKRFTHDLSFSLTLDAASINDRIDMTQYPDMVYGWCFPRLLHYLAALRHRNPGVKIFISKYDYSDAYKRISQDAETAAATVIRVNGIAYICLWRSP